MVTDFKGNNFNEIISSGLFVVDFYADWCAPCKAMAPIVEELSNEYSNIATFLKVNVDFYMDICMEYRIQTIPRIYIFKDGEIKKMFIGVTEKQDIVNILNTL